MKKIVINSESNPLVEERVYMNGRRSFKLVHQWKKCVILVDKIPRSRYVDGVKLTTLKKVNFIESEFERKRSFAFSSNVSENDRRKIRRIATDSYTLSKQGWIFKKTRYKLSGGFSHTTVPVRKLTLYASTIEFAQKIIPKNEYDRYLREGISQSEYEYATVASGPVFDGPYSVSLEIDDAPDQNFNKYFGEKYSRKARESAAISASKSKDNSDGVARYALIGESWTKRSWYELTIYEEFDPSKIEVFVSVTPIFGKRAVLETFSISYNGKEFEYAGGHGESYADCCVSDADGKTEWIEVRNDEDESDDEDNLESQ